MGHRHAERIITDLLADARVRPPVHQLITVDESVDDRAAGTRFEVWLRSTV